MMQRYVPHSWTEWQVLCLLSVCGAQMGNISVQLSIHQFQAVKRVRHDILVLVMAHFQPTTTNLGQKTRQLWEA